MTELLNDDGSTLNAEILLKGKVVLNGSHSIREADLGLFDAHGQRI